MDDHVTRHGRSAPSKVLLPTRGVLFFFVAALFGACTPTGVTIHFNERSTALREQTVLGDDHARDRIALIEVEGVIAEEVGMLFGQSTNPVDRLVRHLNKARADDRVKGVLLHIDSPGGAVTATDLMYRELRRFREQTGKPIVVHQGELAASGGYYLSLAGDEIIAEPTTVTGSIGVIMPTINLSGGMSRLGIESRSVVSGPNKAIANPLEPMHDEHYAILQQIVDDMYARFRGLVVERRGLQGDVVETATDGRVVVASRAKELGLIDEIGSIHDAFRRARERCEAPDARLIRYGTGKAKRSSVYARPTIEADEPPRPVLDLGLPRSLQNLDTGRPYYLYVQ